MFFVLMTIIILLSVLSLVSASDEFDNDTFSDYSSSESVVVNSSMSYVEEQSNYIENNNSDSSFSSDYSYVGVEKNVTKNNDSLTKLSDGSVSVGSFSELQSAVNIVNTGDYGIYTISLTSNITSTAVLSWSRAGSSTKLIINGNGFTVSGDGNSHSFMTISNGCNVTVLNSLFTNFKGSSSGTTYVAGSVLVNFGNLTINNCSFVNGTGTRGGALYNYNYANLTVTNSQFDKNNVTGYGGAIFSYNYATETFSNCSFTNNYAATGGGVIETYVGSKSYFVNCTFINNRAGSMGGILYSNPSAKPQVNFTNCSFINNSASTGGAFTLFIGNVTNCYFEGNNATTGQDMYFSSGSTVTLSDNIFVSNGTVSGSYTDGGGNVVGAVMSVTVSNWLQLVQAFSGISSNSTAVIGRIYLGSGSFNASSTLNFTSSVKVSRLFIYGQNQVLNGSNLNSFLRVGNYEVSISDLTLVDFVNNTGSLFSSSGSVSLSNVVVNNSSCVGSVGLGAINGNVSVSVSSVSGLNSALSEAKSYTGGSYTIKYTSSLSSSSELVWGDTAGIKSLILNFTNKNVTASGSHRFITNPDGYNLTLCDACFTGFVSGVGLGGVVCSLGNLSVVNCSFVGCNSTSSSAVGGGALYSSTGNLSVVGCSFVNCSSVTSGGAIVVVSGSGNVLNNTFTNCTSGNGFGCVSVLGGVGILGNNVFLTCSDYGVSVTGGGCTIENNTLFIIGLNSIRNSTVTIQRNNTIVPAVSDFAGLVSAVGAAKSLSSGSFVITLGAGNYNATESLSWTGTNGLRSLTIDGNGQVINGSGLYRFFAVFNFYALVVENCTLVNFVDLNGSSDGGAFNNGGNLTLRNVTIRGCVSPVGAGVYNTGNLVVSNVTFDSLSAGSNLTVYSSVVYSSSGVRLVGDNVLNVSEKRLNMLSTTYFYFSLNGNKIHISYLLFMVKISFLNQYII